MLQIDAIGKNASRFTATWRALPRTVRALWIILACVCVAWVSFGAYQSHYLTGLRLLGDHETQNLIGQPKDGRGDEWAVYIPTLKQSYLEGFPAQSKLPPYHESFKLFMGIPVKDWSIPFRPSTWAYMALPGSVAMSLQGLFYNVLLLLSIVWLLRNLQVKMRVAVPAAVMLQFSMFYQVWWTSNFAVLGASVLPLAVLTSDLRWQYKLPLLSWALAHMFMGAMYPPFYYVTALSLLPLIVVMRPELAKPREIAVALVALVAATAVYWRYYGAYIEAVALTTYPGTRFERGGGASWSTLLGVLLPTAPATSDADAGLTLYELNAAGTILFALFLGAVSKVDWQRRDALVLIAAIAVAALMAVYAVVGGFPDQVVRYTGLSLVPGRRMQIGLVLLTTFLAAIYISRAYEALRNAYVLSITAAFALLATLAGIREDADGQFFLLQAYPWLFLAFAAAGALLDAMKNGATAVLRGRFSLPCVLWGGALAHVVIFGSFNPIMRSSDILRPVNTQVTRDLKALYTAAGNRPVATVGNFGHLLRGEQLPAYAAIHLVSVSRDDYARAFPELTPHDIEVLFNQMRGLRFDNVLRYDARGLTATMPVLAHSHLIPARGIRSKRGAPAEPIIVLAGPVRVSEVRRTTISQFEVMWKSELRHRFPLSTPLAFYADCRIDKVVAARYPIDYSKDSGEVLLRGLVGKLTVQASTEATARKCVETVRIGQGDGPSAGLGMQVVEFGKLPPGSISAAQWSGRACDVTGEPRRDPDTGIVTFQGYLIGHANQAVPEFSIILEGGQKSRLYQAPAQSGLLRPDVAEYFKQPSLIRSGFMGMVGTDRVLPGDYKVNFYFKEDGVEYFCESGKTLLIRH